MRYQLQKFTGSKWSTLSIPMPRREADQRIRRAQASDPKSRYKLASC